MTCAPLSTEEHRHMGTGVSAPDNIRSLTDNAKQTGRKLLSDARQDGRRQVAQYVESDKELVAHCVLCLKPAGADAWVRASLEEEKWHGWGAVAGTVQAIASVLGTNF